MSIIVEDCTIEAHTNSGGAYDGNTIYKIRMKIDHRYYLSETDYTLDKAIKFRDEWLKSAGR